MPDEQVVEWLEYPLHSNNGKPGMYPFPVADEILKEPLQLENGYLVMPDQPGIGVDVDQAVVERYPFIPGPWSVFRIDSPPQTLAVDGDHSVLGPTSRPPTPERDLQASASREACGNASADASELELA